MKRIVLFGFMTTLSYCAPAQVIEKGDRLLGGDFSISIYNVNPNGPQNNSSGNAGISPSLGFAIKDNLIFGPRGAINYNHQVTKYTDDTKATESMLGIGLGAFLKKYRAVQNRFGLYFDNELSGSLYRSKTDRTGYPDNDPVTGWGAQYSFSPGVFYQFSDRFLGEANIGGVYASFYKPYADGTCFGLGASFFQYFNLGVSYKFSKKRKEE